MQTIRKTTRAHDRLKKAGGVAAVLLWASVSACGSAKPSTYPAGGLSQGAEDCPTWLRRSRFKVVYAPTEAIALWTLPQRLLPGSAQAEELAALHAHIERIAERMTAEAFNQPGRTVRYESLATGASVTVADQNGDRLDATRAQLDDHAEKVNAGVCAMNLATTAPSSALVVSDREWDEP